MITGNLWKLHDDQALQKIDSAAISLLTKSGVRIENDELLDLLDSAGCRIERSSLRCYFSENLIADAIGKLGAQTDDTIKIPIGWNPQNTLSQTGSYPHLLDWPSGYRRLAIRQDVVDMAKMAHTLDDFGEVGRVLVCSEVDPHIEPVWNTLQIAKTTDKPIIGGEVMFVEQLQPLVKMGEILTGRPGETGLIAACDFFIAPLTLYKRQADLFVAKRRLGMPIDPGTMPISGLSAPVTIAGTVAVAVAELIAGWVLGYLINPELPVGGIVCTGSLDMSTASACFTSPEALLQDTMTTQVCHRLYGINVSAVTGYSDAKRPGLEAVFQKMLGLSLAPFGTTRFISAGILSAGQDYSPVQHILDAEINKSIERLWGGFEISDETIALDLIHQQISTGHANFVDTDHTFEHYKSEQWFPRWIDRSVWQGQSTEISAEYKMLERIDNYCKNAIDNYQQPDIDQTKINELEKILKEAEGKL